MPDPTPTPRTPAAQSWARTAGVVAVVAILTFGALYVFQSLRDLPGDALTRGQEVLGDLADLAAAFRQGTVETRFYAYADEVTGGAKLQFATLEQTQVFRRTDSAAILWGELPLPDVVVEATAPVETTYYVDFEEPWHFRLEDGVLRVEAPPIRFNKPSVDASQIRYEVRQGSLLRDEQLPLAKLKQAVTQMAAVRARHSVPLVRETGRRRVEGFVATWVAGNFRDAGDVRVEVRFADEGGAESAVDVERPWLDR